MQTLVEKLSRIVKEFHQQWVNELLGVNDIYELETLERHMHRSRVMHELKFQRDNVERLRTKNKRSLIPAKEVIEAYKTVQRELEQQTELLQQQIEEKRKHFNKGLTSARIEQFHQFLADELLVGDRCGVCLDDIEVGRRMMRLDCNGQHIFCQDCCEKWFSVNNTCPYCRQVL